jgi:hypothetical protein
MDEGALAGELLARPGVTTVARLARRGISERMVERLVAAGRFRRAGNGVVVSTCWPDTLEHRMAVACAITRAPRSMPPSGWSPMISSR